MLPEYLKVKKEFVEELNKIYPKYQLNVKSIEYVIFRNAGWNGYREFLIINYVGGARTIRHTTGDSYSAISGELVNYLDHSNTDLEDFYYETLTSPNWEFTE